MRQKYKVFIQNKPLIFAKKTDLKPSEYQGFREFKCGDYETLVDRVYRKVKRREEPGFVAWCKSPKKAWKTFKDGHRKIAAAGGLVTNKKGQLLLIHRRGWWDIPKGKIDKGETIEEAAVREVEEECGIDKITLGDALPTTWHCYKYKGRRAIKPTYWFNMSVPGNPKLIPQTEEDITDVKWVKPEKLENYLSKMYPALVELVRDWKEDNLLI